MAEKPIMPIFETADEIFAWRDQQRRRHRVMTMGEYNAWAKSGDFFDSNVSADAFRGGLTIILDGRPTMYGGFDD